MKIRVLSPGKKMPAWIQTGVDTYVKRMPHEARLEITELELGNRSKKNYSVASAMQEETKQFEKHLDNKDYIVALDVKGKSLSTKKLAQRLENWKAQGSDVAILIGGPDGLSDSLLSRAQEKISLSDLTLPHALVRVVLAEQLYRAASILAGHPYHRA